MQIISTTFSAANSASMVRAADGSYLICNGQQRPLRWDGLTTVAEDAGIDIPVHAPIVTPGTSGGYTSHIYGTYWVYYRFIDDSGQPSSLSPLTYFNIATTTNVNRLAYSVEGSFQTRVTRVQVWRTTSGQNNTVYLDAEYPAPGGSFLDPPTNSLPTYYGPSLSSATSYRNDCGLKTCEALRILTEDGYPNANRFTPPPAFMSVAIAHKDRIWYLVAKGATTVENRTAIYWSEPGEPESVPTCNIAYVQDEADALVGGFTAYGYLFVFTRRRLYRVSTAGDPRRDLSIVPVCDRGAITSRAWCMVEDAIFLMDDFGIYAFSGQKPVTISDPIANNWRRELPADPDGVYWAIYSPDDGTVRFFCSLGTGLYGLTSGSVICFNVRSGQRWREDYPFTTRHGANFPVHYQVRTVLGGASGIGSEMRLVNSGVLDAAAAKVYYNDLTTWSGVRGTITSVGSNTINDAEKTFPPTSALENSGVLSAVGVDSAWGAESRPVVSFSTHGINHSAFSSSPAIGDTYQIGGIPWKIKLGAFRFVESERSNPRRLHIHFKPLAAGVLYVRFYFDYSTTAAVAAISYDDNAGVSVAIGQSAWKVDLSNVLGYATINFDAGFELRGPASRLVEIQLEGVQPREKVKIYGIDIDGVMAPGG